MRAVFCVACFALLVSRALAVPDFPPGAEVLETQLLAKCDSNVQSWIKDQARSAASSRCPMPRARAGDRISPTGIKGAHQTARLEFIAGGKAQ